MKISGVILVKISRDLCLRGKLHQKLASISHNQPWKRAYAIGMENVNVKSREMIKPISPTYPHNKSINLSVIDQIIPSRYIPTLLFYQNDPSNPIDTIKQTSMLKNSLSKTLVDFYPVAGRVKSNKSIECSDEGVEFCEAHTSENLANFIQNPNLEKLETLLPFQSAPRHANIVMSVQVNYFSCGGMAIGLCLSHKMTDGSAVGDFLNAWSNQANRKSYTRPLFNGASIFPPLQPLNDVIINFETQKGPKEKLSMRRLIFDKNMISQIKGQVTDGNLTLYPTRIEAITGFIWKHLPHEKSIVSHIVNIRTRMNPPIPEGIIGNFAWIASTNPLNSAEVTKYPEFLEELRKGINKIEDTYMRHLFSDDFLLELSKSMASIPNMQERHFLFSSLCRVPVYEVDFGMGKPVWACFPFTGLKDTIVFTSTRCGQGIEAWIYLPEDDIDSLDRALANQLAPLV